MATDQARVKSAAAGKNEAFVLDQLSRAEWRIRLLDTTTALLAFLAGSLAYIVLLILCDKQWQLSAGARQLALVGYFLTAAGYLGFAVVRPLLQRINPYYAALQLEHTLPGAKNSVINWLDLHEQRLAPAIRGALGQRAAKDLARADLERAISGQRTLLTGGVAALLSLIFVILFILFGPAQFFSLLGRAFAPFEGGCGPILTRTRLQMLRPENGNDTVAAGRTVTVAVQVDGKIPDPKKPDALKLHYRYDQTGPYQERLLQPQESAREWATVLSVADVGEGFWYKVTGGDAETPEYRVTVRSAPTVTDFLATYRFRPYVGRAEEVRRERKLEALRGTEVTLQVRSNRTIKSSALLLEDKTGRKSSLAGERLAQDAQAFQVRLVMEDSCSLYRLSFQSAEDESYTDSSFQLIVCLPDQTPVVELTKPGKDIELPVNGLLQVEGKASDDIGVKSLRLQLQAVGGVKLLAKEYREGKSLALPAGGFPLNVEYKDFVDLTKVQTVDGKPYTLQPGMELEYWLEAADACDFPQPNVGKSKSFKVLLQPPAKKDNKQLQQERGQAQKEQQEHEKKQDDQLQKENQQRQDENRQRQQANQNETQPAGEQGQQPGDKPDAKQQPGDKPDAKQGEQGKPGQTAAQDKQVREEAQRLKKEIDKQEQGKEGSQKSQGNKGQGGEPKAGENKASKPQEQPGGEPNKGQNNPGGQANKGENKPNGQQGNDNHAGEKKDGGKPDDKGKEGAGKDGGQPQPMQGDKGEGKSGDPKMGQGEPQAAQGKDAGQDAKDQPKQNDQATGNAKEDQSGNAGKQAAEAKENGTAPGAQDKSAEAKDGSKNGKPGDQEATAEKKGPPSSKPGGEGEKQPQDAAVKELVEKFKQLQSDDPKQREKAASDLEKIKDQAQDPAVKEMAQKMLDAKKKAEQLLAENKPGGSKGDPQPQEKPGESKDGDKGKDGDNGQAKDGKGGQQGMQPPGEAKEGKQEPGMAEPGMNTPEANQNGQPGTGKSKGKLPNVDGGFDKVEERMNEAPRHTATPAQNDPVDPLSQKATETMLEDFKKKLDQKMLERLKMTEEARERFLKNYADLVHRDQAKAAAEAPETPAAPQHGTTPAGAFDKSSDTKPTASTSDTIGTGRALPPPGFREAYKDLSLELQKKTKRR